MSTPASKSPPSVAERAEPWLSIDEIAVHLGVRKESVYRWIENRGLPAERIGKLWKLKLSEVDAWVRARSADHKSKAKPKRGGWPERPPGAEGVVLVVDDDDLVRDTIHDFLEAKGYSVLVASDGGEALELLASASTMPKLIILDLQMPNVDGRQFQALQARDPQLASIPVLVLAASPDPDIKAARVLSKPLRPGLLTAAVDEILSERGES